MKYDFYKYFKVESALGMFDKRSQEYLKGFTIRFNEYVPEIEYLENDRVFRSRKEASQHALKALRDVL